MVETYVIIIIVVIAIVLISIGAILAVYFLTKEEEEPTNNTGNTGNTGGTTNTTGSTNITNNVMRPYPFLTFSEIPSKVRVTSSTIAGNNHLTYTKSYNYSLSIQPGGVIIQMTSTIRNQDWYTLIASEIPGLDGFEVYNSYVSPVFITSSSNLLETIFPVQLDPSHNFGNGFSFTPGDTRQGQTIITCPAEKLGLLKIPAGTTTSSISASNPIYMYGTASIFGFTIPRDDIAQIVAMSSLPLTPGNEVNLTSGASTRLFFYRLNLSTSQVEVIIPTSRFSEPIKNSLINGSGTSVDFNVYTWPTAVKYRRVILTNGTTQNGQGQMAKLYSVFKSFTSEIGQDISKNRLYNVSITYTVSGVKYLLFSNQLSLHGSDFALFYYVVAPNNTLILYFPQRNIFTNGGEYNVLNKDTVILEAWFYQ
jgi:flagellar basal body-associated protein FliL